MAFSFFSKKDKSAQKEFIDISFMTSHAKENAVLKYSKQNPGAIFITWFTDTTDIFKKIFTVNHEDEQRIVEAKHFYAAKFPGKEIVFLEHFPLREKEEQLIQNSEQQSFTVYNALTESFFLYFASEKIIDMMKKMKVAEDEPLQHALISSSVKNAQQKIAKKITAEQPASSQKEWMEKNT